MDETPDPVSEFEQAVHGRAGERALQVSIVVPLCGDAPLLRPVLQGFAHEAEEEDLELLLVARAGDAMPEGLAKDFGQPAWLRSISCGEPFSRSAALNAGIEAARGSVIVLCDPHVAPSAGFVRGHVEFHQGEPSELALHLGALDWGVDAGLIGALVGARAAPRIGEEGLAGRWLTDNVSFKRRLFAGRGLRLDPAREAWGAERLDFHELLEPLGATCTASDGARGLCLAPASAQDLMERYAACVPALIRSGTGAGAPPIQRGWLALRIGSAQVFACCEALLALVWNRCRELDRTAFFASALRDQGDPLVRGLGAALADAIFRLGLARGFLHYLGPEKLNDAGACEALGLPPASDRDGLHSLAGLVAHVVLAEAAYSGAETGGAFGAEVARVLALPQEEVGAFFDEVERIASRRAQALTSAA